MKKLEPAEVKLIGNFVRDGDGIKPDDASKRIDWLTDTELIEVATSRDFGAWEILYKDPNDGRLWEKTYPQGEMHGGGPPTLTCISSADASAKYGYRT